MGVTAKDILIVAASHIGLVDGPHAIREYGGVPGSAWCAQEQWCIFNQIGAADLLPGSKTAWVPTIRDRFRAAGRLFKTGQPGDLVLYDWQPNGDPDHIGILEKTDGRTVQAIEGNTSTSKYVERKIRDIKWVLGFARPAYDAEAEVVPVAPNGDTYGIAREVIAGKWGVGADRIKRLSAAGYDPGVVQVRVNEILRGTAVIAPVSPGIKAETYKVVRGDTLTYIAKKFGTTADALARLNGIKNKNVISVGQVLKVK
jgi:LysM repeat protein